MQGESIDEYKPGGYHPVHVGQIFVERYEVLQRLGWGHFSTVWLSRDLQTGRYVAVKVQKSAKHYYEAALDEADMSKRIAEAWKDSDWIQYAKKQMGAAKEPEDYSYCVQMLDTFDYYGPNGKHFVMVFEVMGINLLDVMRYYDYKGVPLPLVKSIVRQLLIGLDCLHRICKLIHTDIKPENSLLRLPSALVSSLAQTGHLSDSQKFSVLESLQLRPVAPRAIEEEDKKQTAPALPQTPTPKPEDVGVKWADFGNACWVDHHFTDNIQTREYRAPEVWASVTHGGVDDARGWIRHIH